jgi:hypothetical protein
MLTIFVVLLSTFIAQGSVHAADKIRIAFGARPEFTDRDWHFAWSVTDEVSCFIKTNHPTRKSGWLSATAV